MEPKPIQFEDWTNFLNNVSVGIHLVDEAGIIRWVNEPELKAMGYTREEYVNRRIQDFHMDADIIDHILKTLASGEALNAYPARLRAKDGSTAYVLINSNVFKNEEGFQHSRCISRFVSSVAYEHARNEFLRSKNDK